MVRQQGELCVLDFGLMSEMPKDARLAVPRRRERRGGRKRREVGSGTIVLFFWWYGRVSEGWGNCLNLTGEV